MTNQKIRERRQLKRKKENIKTKSIWIGVIILGLAPIAYIAWAGLRPAIGTSYELQERTHLDDGEPVTYLTDPPTSGSHYSRPIPAGFYDVADMSFGEYPEGYLVHGLEHGYITFWYNCEILSASDCSELKNEIRDVISDFNGVKLVAWPWPSIEYPIVMTSWGQMLEFETFDPELATKFININKIKAPEASAP